MLNEKIEIYEVMRIFTPMAVKSRRRILYCDPEISKEDLDQVELAINRYTKTLDEITETQVEKRIKRSAYFQTLKDHYDKNKNKK